MDGSGLHTFQPPQLAIQIWRPNNKQEMETGSEPKTTLTPEITSKRRLIEQKHLKGTYKD